MKAVNQSDGGSRHELNPYASPVGAGGYLAELDVGVGVWRDGNQIVLHLNAELPRICIMTGKPARFGYPLRIIWRQGMRLWPRSLELLAPLSSATHRKYRLRRGLAIAGFLASLAWIPITGGRVFSWGSFGLGGGTGIAADAGLCLIAGAAAFFTYCYYSQLLYATRSTGNYVWLGGADRRFLAKLPKWPA